MYIYLPGSGEAPPDLDDIVRGARRRQGRQFTVYPRKIADPDRSQQSKQENTYLDSKPAYTAYNRCLANTFDYPVSDHRRGVKFVSCQRGGSNPRRHQPWVDRSTS